MEWKNVIFLVLLYRFHLFLKQLAVVCFSKPGAYITHNASEPLRQFIRLQQLSLKNINIYFVLLPVNSRLPQGLLLLLLFGFFLFPIKGAVCSFVQEMLMSRERSSLADFYLPEQLNLFTCGGPCHLSSFRQCSGTLFSSENSSLIEFLQTIFLLNYIAPLQIVIFFL